jgi:ABC-type bacteriocin/lantibiotic exporter with double-glycine peptidase domain
MKDEQASKATGKQSAPQPAKAVGRAAGAGQDWQTLRGKWVAVYAPQGSYAARRAPVVLKEADRTADAVERLLKSDKPPGGYEHADIYLLDPVVQLAGGITEGDTGDKEVEGYLYAAEASSVPTGSDAIVRIVRPESPGDPVTYEVVRLLLSRWFGASLASEPFLVKGIAGVVAARLGIGDTVQEADTWVRAELKAGRGVSVFGASHSGHANGDALDNRVATSFFAYLMDNFGAGPLKQFLKAYDPDRRDQAAITAFQRPIGAIEEAWLNTLKRAPARKSVWRSFFHHVIPLLKPYRLRYIEVSIYMLLGLSYGVIMPLSGKYLLDTVIPSRDLGQLGLFIVGLFALYVLNSLLGMRRAYVSNWINQKVITDLDERLFGHLQRLSHTFYSQVKVGDIVTRFTSDMQLVQNALTQLTGTGPFMALTAVFAAVTVLILSPVLGSLVLIIVPLFALTYRLLGSRLQKASTQRQQLVAQLIGTLQENVSAHAVVKAYGLENKAMASFRGGLTALLNASLRLVKIAVLFETSMTLTVTLGQLMVLGVGGYLVMQGHITIGTLLAFIGLLPSLVQPISSLSSIGQTMQTASGAITRVTELLEEPLTVAEKAGAVDLPPLGKEIRLENVEFSYGTGNPILNDLSLTIPAGSNVAIVGPSGSGKSTIVSLLLRFYDPEGGRTLFDGVDLKDATLASLRNQIGLVFQDTFVFDTTLRENIAHGSPGAKDSDIVAAAKAARLDEYIQSLPGGYDTVMGERGVRMSGGQRQRLAIARALIRNPRILVFDEATSALDSQTEREILDTLKDVAKGRTVISITHRLAIAAMSDHVYVLEHGRLVEDGTHSRLVNAGGLYQKLYSEQTGRAAETRRSGISVEQLRAVPLFSNLSDAALSSLSGKLVRERFFVEEDIVTQGDLGDKLYIIHRGQVEVLVNVVDGTRKVNTLRAGDYFGEMALLTDEARTATIRAAEPSELFSLSRADFSDLINQEEAVRASLQESVDQRRAALSKLREVQLVGETAK